MATPGDAQFPITPGQPDIPTTPFLRRPTDQRDFQNLNNEELQVLATLTLNALKDRGISFPPIPYSVPKHPDIFDNAKFEQIACAGLQPKYNGSPDELIPTLNAIHIQRQNEVWYSATFMIQQGETIDLIRNFSQVTQETVQSRAKELWDDPDSLTTRHTKGTGLPIITTATGIESYTKFCAAMGVYSPSTKGNHHLPSISPVTSKQNLSPYQRIKLLIHERCNHKNMKAINHWIRSGYLPIDPAVASAPDPICVACQYGKAHRKSHTTDTAPITASHDHPGAGVSADQLEAGYPGRLPTTRGLPTTKRYKYCNILVDHYSKYIFPTFHETIDVSELIKSKTEFQTFAARFNVKIKSIRADNGAYASALFKTACDNDRQDLSFCVVGGHWQNGVAERHIGIITQTARTLLLHAMANWPAVVNEEFWPFAIRHACTFHNASLRYDTKKSPHHMFTGNVAPWKIDDFRVFGSPVFVLDKKLQDGDSLPKWKARSWMGVYVGHSLAHSGNVPVIYNPQTTHITPQFHVVFDDQFSTVVSPSNTLTDQHLESLFYKSSWLHKDDYANMEDLHIFETYWSNPPPLKSKLSKSNKRKSTEVQNRDIINTQLNKISVSELAQTSEQAKYSECATNDESATQLENHEKYSERAEIRDATQIDSKTNSEQATYSEHAAINAQTVQNVQASELSHVETIEGIQGPNAHHALACIIPDTTEHIANDGPNKETRITQPCLASTIIDHSKTRINLVSTPCSLPFKELQANLGIHAEVYTAQVSAKDAVPAMTTHSPPCDNFVSLLTYTASLSDVSEHLTAYMACNNKEDILTQSQMLKAHDSAEFIACQRTEITGLQQFDVMDIEHISNLPAKAKLLSSIWSYRRKRLPNGVLLKHKSRICVNGKEQAFGRDYWETYAPVASWATIRLLMLLSTLLDLKSRQVDYTQAFPQAKLDDPVFMKIPQGWYINSEGILFPHSDPRYNDTSHYLRLKRNLYGCKQAARNWFKHLTAGLLKEGFTQSKTDCCLFLRNDCIIVVYVDDCLIFSKSDDTINNLIKQLSSSFILQDEGDVSAFLGVQINKDANTKTIHLTQPGLIQQVINDLGITMFGKGKDTPVDSILHADPDGSERLDKWNYRSIIGKLNYLANNTRPDISMAVHQCAKFCSHPKAIHEIAVKRIVRYLLATKDKGLILKPSMSLTLDMFVDADFAGMWHKEYSALRDNVLSRTGFVITFCGCPITWCSKLQTEIVLSTTESEYIALSTGTRELLPLRRILEDIHRHSFINIATSSSTPSSTSPIPPSKVYEDNNACIVLATTETHFKPRTKHISLKYHHFHDQIRNGNLQIIRVDINSNIADIFTKPLSKLKFHTIRHLLMGW
jgi:hypothetical protein